MHNIWKRGFIIENFKNINIGFAMTGSFCTFNKALEIMKEIKKLGANIIPIMSYNSYNLDTRFGDAKGIIEKVENITENKIIHTIQGAEPIGPKNLTDLMLVLPCTGNTIAKLSHSIIDTPVTMAVKSHLRNEKPVLIGISTNDALSGSAENIGKLLNRKHYYFIPFKQDNPITKPRSIVFDSSYVIKSIHYALEGSQIQPILA